MASAASVYAFLRIAVASAIVALAAMVPNPPAAPVEHELVERAAPDVSGSEHEAHRAWGSALASFC